MNTTLLFDFTVDKENKTIHVTREFAADLARVWDAWTKPELLDQWWAPRPYRTVTKSMDFREGGRWHYAMVGPENETHWCLNDYRHIDVQKSFSGLDAFCDENGTINTDFPRTIWRNVFTADGDTTMVSISLAYDDLADLEKIIELGFREGFTMALGNLDELLASR